MKCIVRFFFSLFFSVAIFATFNFCADVDAGGSRAIELFVYQMKKQNAGIFSNMQTDDQDCKEIEVAPDKTFLLSVKINEAKASGERDLKIQGLENFSVTGTSSSKNISFVNGQLESRVEKFYYLSAKKEGVFKIGPATIVSSAGQQYKSDWVTVNVVKSETASTDAFLTVLLSIDGKPLENRPIFVGQKIDMSFDAYFKADVFNSLHSCSETIGTSSDFIISAVSKDPVQTKRFVNGAEYNCVTKTFSVVAQAPGTKELPRISCFYRALKNDDQAASGFASIFGLVPQDFEDGTLVANNGLPIIVNVKDVDQDVDAIGEDFEISLESDKKKLEVGQATTIKLVISGNGDFGSIVVPELVVPEGCKIYPSKNYFVEKKAKDNKKTKVFEYILQASKEGELVIQGQKFVYFDTKQEQKTTLESNQLIIYVVKSSLRSNLKAPLSTNKPVEKIIPSNQPQAQPEGDLDASEESFGLVTRASESPWLFVLILFLIALLIIVLVNKKRLQLGFEKTVAFRKARTALTKASYGYEIGRIYYIFLEYFAIRLNLERQTIDVEAVDKALYERNIQPELVLEVVEFLEKAADIVFGKGRSFYGQVETSMFFKTAIDLLARVDERIKK